MKKKLKELTEESLRLRGQLQQAMRQNDVKAIQKLSFKLTHNNSLVVDYVVDLLERIEKANANNAVRPTIGSDIKIAKHTPINLNRPDRNRGK